MTKTSFNYILKWKVKIKEILLYFLQYIIKRKPLILLYWNQILSLKNEQKTLKDLK